MGSGLYGHLRSCKGQSLLELALVLPVLAVILLGVIDLSRAIMANNAIINMSREGASLAARSMSIPQQDIMNSLASTAQSLGVDTNGKRRLAMYITNVRGVGGVPVFQSQEAWHNNNGGPRSQINKDSVGNYLQSVTVANGESAYIFEVAYTFEFFTSATTELRSVTVF